MQVDEYDESTDPLFTPKAQKSSGTGWSSSVIRGNAGLLTQSMKKMISSRPRVLNMGLGMNLRSNATFSSNSSDVSARDVHYEQEMEVFASFAAAVDRKSKDEMVFIITQHPQVVHIRNLEDEQLALHLVCRLMPNYFYMDVIEMMVNANRESPACMDKSGQTPLHLLCQNTSITLAALTTLLTILPAAAWMCDKQSNLALHYLCMNQNVDITMLQQLGQDETLHLRNSQNQTPLHCFAIKQDLHTKKSPFLYLLDRCVDTVGFVDAEGRYLLHWICEARGIDVELLEKVITEAAAQSPDCHQDLPLHILCQNQAVDKTMLKQVLHMNPDAVYARTENDLTALHFLCSNGSVDPALLNEFLGFDKCNTTPGLADKYGATPVHVLCMNESIRPAHLRALLVVCTDDALTQDIHGCSPLHYLCMNRAITSELVWLFLERAEELVREIDCDGRTPLHHLCANRSVAAITLEILYDACPSAAMVADKQLRLPVQYLVDNLSSPAETTALLISGPSSYRLRYEFVGVVGGQQAAQAFYQQGVLVYRQNNLAMDTTTSRKVLITFFSTRQAIDHEREKLARLNLVADRLICKSSSSVGTPNSLDDGKANSNTVDASRVDTTMIGDYRMPILETFDDAKRRVALRSAADLAPEEQIGDACVTLQHGLVIEAPAYTLDALFSERLEDIENIRMVIADIGACLHFWHREALMVHGNVSLTSIGHFPGRGLRLIHMHTSREFHENTIVVGRKAMDARICPPEATRAFLASESFLPTPESDIWQFGCLMYHLITGQSLVAALAPWSEGLGDQNVLHLLSAVTNEVIQQLIDKVEPSSLRGLLQATLLIKPAQRWTIDRLMHIDAFRVERDASTSDSFEEMSSKVQRRVDAELLSIEHQRSAKHAQDQLAFVRNEQSTLRAQFLATKTRLREAEEARDQLSAQVVSLSGQLEHLTKQNDAVQQEVSVFARNHQSMTLQLHTTMQMLVNLVPLVKNVYGANSDEFLSNVLSQASGSESLSTIDIGGGGLKTGFRSGYSHHRRTSAVQLVKRQLQKSILAQGCIHTWAHSTPPPILEPHELSYSSSSLHDDNNTLSNIEVSDRESDGTIKDVGIFLEPEERIDNQHEHEET